jgi:ABC-type sulfate/molybdate transport systems ATPase subunit
MLEITDLLFEIPNRGPTLVNARISNAEIVCITGPSGIGKSTLLRVLAGFHPTVSGRVQLAGQDLGSMAPENRYCGFLLQSRQLFPGMTVLENLEFPLKLRQKSWSKDLRRSKALAILERAKLSPLANQDAMTLSGGEAQRIAFCRVLLSNPKYLLLDEPFSALDPVSRADFRAWLKQELQESGRPTLMVSHDPSDILDLEARVYQWPEMKSPLDLKSAPAPLLSLSF